MSDDVVKALTGEGNSEAKGMLGGAASPATDDLFVLRRAEEESRLDESPTFVLDEATQRSKDIRRKNFEKQKRRRVANKPFLRGAAGDTDTEFEEQEAKKFKKELPTMPDDGVKAVDRDEAADAAYMNSLRDKFGGRLSPEQLTALAAQDTGTRRGGPPGGGDMGELMFEAAATEAARREEKAIAERNTAINKHDIAVTAERTNVVRAEEIRAEGDAEAAVVRGEAMDELNVARQDGQDELKMHKERIDRKLHEYEAAVDSYKNAPVGVTQSRREKAFGVLAVALGAFSAAQSGGPNQAAEILNAHVDQQLRMQQIEINKRGKSVDFSSNALANARAVFGDEQQAQRAARSMIMEDMRLELDEVASRTNSKARMFDARKFGAQVDQKTAKLRVDIAQHERTSAMQRASTAEQASLHAQRDAKVRRAEIAQRYDEMVRREDQTIIKRRIELAQAARQPAFKSEKWAVTYAGLPGAVDNQDMLSRAIKRAEALGVWSSTMPRQTKTQYIHALNVLYRDTVLGQIRRNDKGPLSDDDKREGFNTYGGRSFTTLSQFQGANTMLEVGINQAVFEATTNNPDMSRSRLGVGRIQQAEQFIQVQKKGGLKALVPGGG